MKIELVLLTNDQILTSEFEDETVFGKFTKVNSVRDFENLVDEFASELKTIPQEEIYSKRGNYFKYIDLSSNDLDDKFINYSSFRNLTDKLINIEAFDNEYKKSLLTQLPQFGTRAFKAKAFI